MATCPPPKYATDFDIFSCVRLFYQLQIRSNFASVLPDVTRHEIFAPRRTSRQITFYKWYIVSFNALPRILHRY